MPYITVHMQMEGRFILKDLKSVHLSLAPFSSREFKYRMPLYFRGRYDIGVNYIEIQDLLGLFSIRRNPFEKRASWSSPGLLNRAIKAYRRQGFQRVRSHQGFTNPVTMRSRISGNMSMVTASERSTGNSHPSSQKPWSRIPGMSWTMIL